jgi:SAM-dependent methyltransferase
MFAMPPSITQRTRRDQAHTLLRSYWDADARTYDRVPEHGAWSPGERAAWAAALRRWLPPQGRILDAGAGTGFLSLAAARLGYRVTALDISGGMLARLEGAAAREGLEIETVRAAASEPPPGPFDAIVERLVLWTLPDAIPTLAAWREISPRLLAFEGVWGQRDYLEGLRRRGRETLRRLRRLEPEHHAPYGAELRSRLPLASGPSPSDIVAIVEESGWPAPRLERLRDIEWARLMAMSPLDRLLGVTPEYVVVAGEPA